MATAKSTKGNNGTSNSDQKESSSSILKGIYMGVRLVFGFLFVRHFLWRAYDIRLHAIREYGTIIHEFDPWFNYRATEYLYLNGWQAFKTWFDYKVWYPLGRPVGTTIYPGMQVTAVFIKKFLRPSMSLNDVCCYMPAWFGSIATFLTGMLAYECSHSTGRGYYSNLEVLVATMAFMSIVPAHLMRSIGGGYDNESIAVTAMVLTFYLWCRSLRPGKNSYWFSILAGIAYFNMVAAWGGYVFVLNMVALHAGVLVLLGRYSPQLYRSFTLFYIIGTALAIQVPVVGWAPLKSLEQLTAAAVFVGYQLIQLTEIIIHKQRAELAKKGKSMPKNQAWKIRILVFSGAAVTAMTAMYVLASWGYFSPITSRVRGLFVKHTKTGNPLVDSVAEHQPASKSAYYAYLNILCILGPCGFLMLLHRCVKDDRSSFLCLYGIVTYFFSAKMVRLIILAGPVASALGGVAVGRSIGWATAELLPFAKPLAEEETLETSSESKKSKKSKKKKENVDSPSTLSKVLLAVGINPDSTQVAGIKKLIGVVIFGMFFFAWSDFRPYCEKLSHQLSNPSIIFRAQTNSGKDVLVDDYREAYFWLRDNTPEDSRVLAWWDYGYQITGISNRTTVADGNTWNHEHIALLGMILTGPEKQSHRIARHLADYVLVWGGGGGDDLAKSPHLARIANSVYRNHCPNDPTCRAFGYIDRQGTPSPMMARSFLYKLHSHKLKPGVQADPNRFKEVYRTKYGKVRIFKILGVSKESKEWVAQRANKICDTEDGWFCRGQYPPALEPVLNSKTDFAQLEDFNSKKSDDEYQKQYFENLNNPQKAKQDAAMREKERAKAKKSKATLVDDEAELLKARIAERTVTWEDNEETTHMWSLINKNNIGEIKQWLKDDPSAAYMRSADGRGPMWWAYEEKNEEIVRALMSVGASFKDKDKYGKTPLDMLTEQEL